MDIKKFRNDSYGTDGYGTKMQRIMKSPKRNYFFFKTIVLTFCLFKGSLF